MRRISIKHLIGDNMNHIIKSTDEKNINIWSEKDYMVICQQEDVIILNNAIIPDVINALNRRMKDLDGDE